MAAYSLDTLLHRWALHQITSEQAIGQMLLILQELEPRILRLEQSVNAPQMPPPQTPAPVVAPAPTAIPRKRNSQRKLR